ncbi:hypothetical protein [Leclercia tamurae]|uniref:hypothetical protein n=1 Tax=Leclercia tamurae TaxID=2926467 RepID=UPI0036F46E2D
MNTWLTGFQTETHCTETDVYMLIEAENLALAEAGAMSMGRTWWPDVKEDSADHCWLYPERKVWFSSIVLLDDVENTVLRGLKFLDWWIVTGTPEWPVIRDRCDMDWQDYTR